MVADSNDEEDQHPLMTKVRDDIAEEDYFSDSSDFSDEDQFDELTRYVEKYQKSLSQFSNRPDEPNICASSTTHLRTLLRARTEVPYQGTPCLQRRHDRPRDCPIRDLGDA